MITQKGILRQMKTDWIYSAGWILCSWLESLKKHCMICISDLPPSASASLQITYQGFYIDAHYLVSISENARA